MVDISSVRWGKVPEKIAEIIVIWEVVELLAKRSQRDLKGRGRFAEVSLCGNMLSVRSRLIFLGRLHFHSKVFEKFIKFLMS